MSAPSFTTMPREIRQKILGYAFQNAIHLDLLLHHHQLHHSHASALLTSLTTIAAMSLPLAEDCRYIIDMVVKYGEKWRGVVGKRIERIEREYAASFAVPRRAGEERRQAIANIEYVKIAEFTCHL